MSAKTSTSKYDGNDVVMFNLADDPYELYNVWDQNKSMQVCHFHDWMALESTVNFIFSKYDSNNLWNK